MAKEGPRQKMKIRNHYIYSENDMELRRLAEEYQMTGRDTKIEPGKLIVFALPRRRRSSNANARKTN